MHCVARRLARHLRPVAQDDGCLRNAAAAGNVEVLVGRVHPVQDLDRLVLARRQRAGVERVGPALAGVRRRLVAADRHRPVAGVVVRARCSGQERVRRAAVGRDLRVVERVAGDPALCRIGGRGVVRVERHVARRRVRAVEDDLRAGGQRELGIPVVRDRAVGEPEIRRGRVDLRAPEATVSRRRGRVGGLRGGCAEHNGQNGRRRRGGGSDASSEGHQLLLRGDRTPHGARGERSWTLMRHKSNLTHSRSLPIVSPSRRVYRVSR